jgi:hypothetical protein
VVAVVACVAAVAAACGGGASDRSATAGSSRHGGSTASSDDPTGGASAAQVASYGYGPSAAAGVTYQDDVVMVPAGPAAVRSVTTDGLVWTLDGGAAGVGDLRVGSVLVATARATGRVVKIREDGDDRVVTLAPVALTDIVRDGTIDLTRPLAAGSSRYQAVPDQPGALSVPTEDDLGGGRATTRSARRGAPRSGVITVAAPSVAVGRASIVCSCGASDGELPPASKGSVEIEAGDYKIVPAYQPGELSLDINHDGHVKVGVHFAFAVSELSVDAGVSIADGVIGSSRLVIDGIKGLEVSLAAGTEDGDNDKVRVEVPVEIGIPIPPSPATAGLPLQITVEFTFSVETAITGKNSTIQALGKYGLSGPIGVRGGKVLAPTFSVEQSIIDSLQGLTLGPSGVVFAVKTKVQAGLGIAEAYAGPYGFVTTSLGVTNGSSLGAPLARCKGATLDMEVGGGASIEISSPLVDALKKLLPPGTELPEEAETSTNVLHRSQVVPDVPLCQGGAG